MNLLIVVQRYGAEILGGSERCARGFAENFVRAGHQVDVLTSCASDYRDWRNTFAPGTEALNGVTVHRLPVFGPKDGLVAIALQAVLEASPKAAPLFQQAWARAQGPFADLQPWLEERASSYDVALFFTYLYSTTTLGVPVASRLIPTVLFPTAHDEAPLRFGLVEEVMNGVNGLAFLTDEEASLVISRFSPACPSMVTGVGTDLTVADPNEFRETAGIDAPYLIYAGRVDPAKGVPELIDNFSRYKATRGGPLQLIFSGEPLSPEVCPPDVTCVGFLSENLLRSALAGAVALQQPSVLESYSLVLAESWAQSRPAIVNGRSPVLAGQADRSRAAVACTTFEQWEDAVDLLLETEVASWMGDNGRAWVESHCDWPSVLARLESFLDRVITGHREG